MKPPDDPWEYWATPPPEPSANLAKWLAKIEAGWTPNRRIRLLGRDDSVRYFVYAWEWHNVLYPLLIDKPPRTG